LTAAVLFASAVFLMTGTVSGRWMIVGNDEKTTWDDQGKQLFFRAGRRTVSARGSRGDPLARIIATLPLENSVYGPPTNRRPPDESSRLWPTPKLVEKDGQPAMVPDNKRT
jgi:hypothetical protein